MSGDWLTQAFTRLTRAEKVHAEAVRNLEEVIERQEWERLPAALTTLAKAENSRARCEQAAEAAY